MEKAKPAVTFTSFWPRAARVARVDKYVSNVAECYSSSTGKYTVDPYQLYDPRSGVNTGGTITRTRSTRTNWATPRLLRTSTIGAAIVKLFPAPNATGTATGRSNYNSNATQHRQLQQRVRALDYNLRRKITCFSIPSQHPRSESRTTISATTRRAPTLTRETGARRSTTSIPLIQRLLRCAFELDVV